ncbi:hypothetical protein F5B21DRAFT_216661 [Xylaria acuta]|nr:hypothetical protein F5B21DRAFT_216661 [Xylaria acuta]
MFVISYLFFTFCSSLRLPTVTETAALECSKVTPRLNHRFVIVVCTIYHPHKPPKVLVFHTKKPCAEYFFPLAQSVFLSRQLSY